MGWNILITSITSMSSEYKSSEKVTLNQFPQLYGEVHFRKYLILLSTSKFKSPCSLYKEQWENPEMERQRMAKGLKYKEIFIA